VERDGSGAAQPGDGPPGGRVKLKEDEMKNWTKMVRGAQVMFFLSGAAAFLAVMWYVLAPLSMATIETLSTLHDGADLVHLIKPQIAPAAHTVGIILQRSAVVTDEAAKASVAQRQYWNSISENTSELLTEARVTARKYGDVADTVNAQLPVVFTGLNDASDAAKTSLLTSNTEMIKLGIFFDEATGLVRDARAGLDNPELAESRKSLARILLAWAAGSEDVQKKLHNTLYPAHQSRFGMVMTGVRVAGPVGELVYNLSNIHH
jgi:hypothetical protein